MTNRGGSDDHASRLLEYLREYTCNYSGNGCSLKKGPGGRLGPQTIQRLWPAFPPRLLFQTRTIQRLCLNAYKRTRAGPR